MKDSIDSPFFKKSHYKQEEIVFVFMNATTSKDCRMYQDCAIEEYGEDWLQLRVPSNTCKQEHRLLLHLISKEKASELPKTQLVNGSIKDAFEIFGVVESIEAVDGTKNRLRFKFTTVKEDEWKKFLEVRKTVQKQVDNLIRKIKG